MTVADLIADLQRHPPHKPVRVVLTSVYMADESGEWTQPLSETEAAEVDQVTHEGAYILIRGR